LLGRLCTAGVQAGGGGGGSASEEKGQERRSPDKVFEKGESSELQRRDPTKREKRSLRILVVEDHWANQKLLEAMLKQRGHEVRCSENGLEAVNLTLTVEFDLILMDCNMPVLDGFEATERIRARKGLNEKVAIIAVTANAMKGDRDKCMASGMDDYITKPVQRQKLHEMIAKWTGIEASASTASSPTARSVESAPSPVAGTAPSMVPPRAKKQQSMVIRNNSSSSLSAVKPRILLVDDDNTLRLLVKSRLERDNSTVIDAGDGEEALIKFKDCKPDIVISDVFMPKMDGFELCRQIRKLDKSIPIVMLTSMNDVQDRIKGLDAGADDYIVKPFAPKELEARVRSLLRRSQGTAAAPGEGGGEGKNASGARDASAAPASILSSETSASVVAKVQQLDSLIGLFNQHLAKVKAGT